jgi:SAM-dependent methyltransferase
LEEHAMQQLALYDIPPLYDLVVRQGPCEAFYRDLVRRTGGPVLDLACGTGRLTIPLAREGHLVVGLDASVEMLGAAEAKARAEEADVELVQADMRSFDLGRRFALVLVCCNSLAHLTTSEDLRACFRCIRNHLAPDGLLAFDIVNPNLRALVQPHCKSVRLDVGPNPSSGIAVEEVGTYDPIRQIHIAHWRVCEPSFFAQDLAPFSLRLIFPQELPLLLEVAGLELTARYGDFERNPLTAESLNQICLARAL